MMVEVHCKQDKQMKNQRKEDAKNVADLLYKILELLTSKG